MPRIIATSRKSLIDAVEQGRFRDDLYYLLARTVIALPPLKAREQIAHLAQALATSLSGKDVVITPEAAETLRMHHWPGNVRELRNVLQQALIEGDGRRISRTDLQAIAQNVPIQADTRTDLLPNARYDERTMIADALSGARWNVTQAARNLGIGRATIHRKMKQYGIMRPE
ncbi:helix-turn-helix domain-containing protein [Phaeobacter sp. J2-8]|uniref:helix-turn-helix domain-containing protein n=1 Tax=Phaeobacter sp. J2-8 TaxID=2931394 RepID=UPI001FD57921|nr:helix-turn-helix domain-containing protein [Phaeobacter sp. J2-8]MCJ7871316.1 hypothetical protein [Phaeobacter sp. J2-8]